MQICEAETSFQCAICYSVYFCKNHAYCCGFQTIFRFFKSFYSVDSVKCDSVLNHSNLCFWTKNYIWIEYVVFLWANIALLLGWMFGYVFFLLFCYISDVTQRALSIIRDRKALTPIKHAHTMKTGLYISLLLLRLYFTTLLLLVVLLASDPVFPPITGFVKEVTMFTTQIWFMFSWRHVRSLLVINFRSLQYPLKQF